MRYLLFSICICVGCVSDYKALVAVAVDQNCVSKFRPTGIETSWFDAGVDVTGKHISGLLLIKNMSDSSDRVVFTNEAGVKFLDFEWKKDGTFKVYYVIDQLDKRAVVNLLKNDFELILGVPFKATSWKAWNNGKEIFFGTVQKNETYYFITDKDCASLLRIESGSDKKRKVTVRSYGRNRQQPDSIHLQHHTFDMKIILKKIERE